MTKKPSSLSKSAKKQAEILETSRKLFNENGVTNVTTNHIAAAMSISPGNLYYHFRNKEDIVWRLFQVIDHEVSLLLELPHDEQASPFRLIADIGAVFRILTKYRFLFRDIVGLTTQDERIRNSYQNLQNRTIHKIAIAFDHPMIIGMLFEGTDRHTKRVLARMVWMVIVNWISFIELGQGRIGDTLSDKDLAQGVYHVITIMRPHMNERIVTGLNAFFDTSFLELEALEEMEASALHSFNLPDTTIDTTIDTTTDTAPETSDD